MKARSWIGDRWELVVSGLSALYLVLFPLFYWSYLGNPLFDYGAELYIYWRLAEGALLYRDLDYLYGPLPVLLSTAAIKIGGRAALITMNLAFSLCMLGFLQAFLSRFVSRAVAAFSLFFIAFFFATNQLVYLQNYNFFTPYKPGALYGLLFSASAFLSIAWPRMEGKLRSTRWHFAAGVLTAATFLAKQEHAVAIAAGLAVLLAFRLFARGRARDLAADLGATAAGFLTLFLGTILAIMLYAKASFSESSYWLLKPYLALLNGGVTGQKLYTGLAGTDDPLALRSSVLTLLLAFLLCLLAWRTARRKMPEKARLALMIVPALALFCAFLTPQGFEWLYSTLALYRALPLACVLLFFACLIEMRRVGGPTNRQIVFAGAAAFSAVLCLKIFLGFRLHHYAFVLGPPAFVLLIVAFREAAKRLEHPRSRATFAALLLSAGIAHALVTVQVGANVRALMTIPIEAAGSTFRADGPTAVAMRFFTSQLRASLKNPDDTLTVLPEGNFFNLVLQKKSPLRFISLYPDQYALNGEAALLRQMGSEPATFIAFYPRNMEEYGHKSFTEGYGRGAYEWVKANYVRVTPEPEFREAWDKLGFELWKKR